MLTNNSFVIPAKAAGLLPIQPGDADYTCLPLFHINAQIYSALGMMAVGGTLILSDRFSPTKFWHELFTYKPKFFNSIGSITQILYSLPPTAKDTIQPARYAIANGTPKQLWVKFEQRFNVTIIEGYSQTEDPLPFLNYSKPRKAVGSFGVPVFPDLGHEIKIIDENRKEVPPDIRGELIRRSPCTMVGYWNDPVSTGATIHDGWLYTGDIVVGSAEGFISFVENKQFLVRRADESIAPWEVESTIKDLPKIEDCAVIPVPDAVKGQEIKALVKLRAGQTEETCPQREIVGWTAQRLAYFKVPRYIEYTDALPYIPTGRLDKAKLYEEHRNKQTHGWDRDKEMPDWRTQLYKAI